MNTPSHPPQNNTTQECIERFIDSCRDRGLSKYTVRWYLGILKPFSLAHPELPTDALVLEKYIGGCTAGDERRHGYFRAIRSFYYYLERQGLAVNPVKNLKPPRVRTKSKQTMTAEQLRQLLDYPGHSERIHALLWFLVDTGARVGEAAGLTGADIGVNTVKVNGKTGSRIVPVSPKVRTLLVNLIPPSTYADRRLFGVCANNLSHLVSKAIRAAGLPGFSAHSLRHTFATLWNGSDTALKHILGHSTWSMVEHYRQEKEAAAVSQHTVHSPLAQINHPEDPPAVALENSDILDRLLQMAMDLGAAQETIRRLEAGLIEYSVKRVHREC